MGITYKIESAHHTFANPLDAYIPHVNWKHVMDFLNIEFTHDYDQQLEFVSESGVVELRDNLRQIVNTDSAFLWDDERKAKGELLRTDAAALLSYFEFYVTIKARIVAF